MFAVVPWLPTVACQVCPPLGAVTVTEERMKKVLSLTSTLHVGSALSAMRTSATLEGVLGMVQL